MKRCTNCQRKFPARLINEMVESFGGKMWRRWLCPLCALTIRNETHGLPPDEPFAGPVAQSLWEEAKTYIDKKGDTSAN